MRISCVSVWKGRRYQHKGTDQPKVVSLRHDSVSLRRINRLIEAGKSDSLRWKTASELSRKNPSAGSIDLPQQAYRKV